MIVCSLLTSYLSTYKDLTSHITIDYRLIISIPSLCVLLAIVIHQSSCNTCITYANTYDWFNLYDIYITIPV